MYSTKTAVSNNEEFSSAYMPAGINENVTLKEVNVKKSTTQLDFLEIVFENENGQTASMTEWKNSKGLYIKTDEDLQKRDDQQFGRIMQIVDLFYPTREDASFNTFVEMINWVKSKLDPMIPTKKELRLKVVYDKNNYTTISKNGVFVEPMTVTKEESQIKQWKRDNFERTIIADKEAPAADPLAGSTTSTQETENSNISGANDLPF